MKKIQFGYVFLIIIIAAFTSVASCKGSNQDVGRYSPTALIQTPTSMSNQNNKILNDENLKEELLNRLKDIKTCKLPCFLDIIPGRDEWDSAQSHLTSLRPKITSFHSEDWPNYQFIQDAYFLTYPIGVKSSYFVLSNTIQAISFGGPDKFVEFAEIYSPQQIFFEYGIPDEIWVYSYTPVMAIDVVYFSKGIRIRYSLEEEYDKRTDKVVGCLETFDKKAFDFGFSVDLWNPLQVMTFNDLGQHVLFKFNDPSNYHLLQDVTNFSVKNLYDQVLKQGNSVCIETKRSSWKY